MTSAIVKRCTKRGDDRFYVIASIEADKREVFFVHDQPVPVDMRVKLLGAGSLWRLA